ncbi:3-isopropylmalate dehydratase small subunit [Caldinitratiruptor microaerophilus]|uniref:3-isopropylmalate dehydratase small subunit n=1 Tax=Caldinitratiruptor microaerophilus TaxID=671077 RepID=A0AA35CKD3_9FIRM|nr:3-isopropylmalate dehydratase small subunit [Caldinitratiruptor microaerophilus]
MSDWDAQVRPDAEALGTAAGGRVRGRAHKFGPDIDTDVIIPAYYLNTIDPVELGKHCMEAADPDFSKKVKPGDIIVAGKNFGSGSSREHAPIAIKGCGIGAVVAESFARIFFRNAINIGLPILESPEAAAAIQAGDEVEIDLEAGRITDLTTGQTFQATPLPPFMMEIFRAGGLVPYLRQKIERQRAAAQGA